MHKKNVELVAKVLKLKQEGLSNAIIAERLGVKVPFVEYAYRQYRQKNNEHNKKV